MERKLIDYLPHVVRDYAEYQGLTAGEQPEFERAWDRADELLDNQFVLTAGNLGLSRWEEILGIVPKATDTLDDRRFRVLTRLNEKLPYTLPQLQKILQILCGEGNFSAEMEAETYELIVKIGLAAKQNFRDVEALLERVSPENLIINLSQLYNTHAGLGRFTHVQLTAHSHHDLRNEVLQNG